MSDKIQDDDDGRASQRFAIDLLVIHPNLDPLDIGAALGLDGHFMHRAGDPRKTPKGTLLPGTYRDTRWRHCRRYETTGQHFADKIAALIEDLERHKAFLVQLRSTGGSAEIIIRFLGDPGYFGDTLSRQTLARLADLDIDLGIECYMVPQH